MTVSSESVNLATLRKIKNTVIGNPSAKLQLARDGYFIRNLIDGLNYPSSNDARVEAAHIVASLSYGSDEALLSLLHANALSAFLYAIAHFQLIDPPYLRSAFLRALRALTVSIADVVGPSQWGLGPESSIAKDDAKDALEFLFQLDSLDTLLPLLADPSPQISTSVAQLLASAIRARHHRRAVSEWLPQSDRAKQPKTRRGWEKTSAVTVGPGRQGGWVARQLTALLESRDVKLLDAALSALATLSKDNLDVANALSKSTNDRDTPSPLSVVLTLSKSRSLDVQLAACLCATHIIRATSRPSIPSGHYNYHHHYTTTPDESATRTVMNIVNRMISSPTDGLDHPNSAGSGISGTAVTIAQRTRACFVLYYLVSDDTALCQAAFDRGCLAKLVSLVTSLPLASPPHIPALLDISSSPSAAFLSSNALSAGSEARDRGESRIRSVVYAPSPQEGLSNGENGQDEWEEPESISALREAALTAIAAISLFDNDVRRALTEPSPVYGYHPYSSSPPASPPFPPYPGDAGGGGPIPQSATIQNLNSTGNTNLSSSTYTNGINGNGNSTSHSSSNSGPPLLPVILSALTHPSPGVRYAACQCVRAMSRAVAVLRTNIVDSGLGIGVWRFCVKKSGEEEEEDSRSDSGGGSGSAISSSDGAGEHKVKGETDKRVIGAALAVVCNMVNDFSPLRQILLDDGLMPRLVEILAYEEAALRTSALWAIKNLLYHTSTETKKRVMKDLEWERLLKLSEDPDTGVREQALNVLRNIAEDEEGIELVLVGLNGDVLLDHIAGALKSSSEDVVLQAAYLLANLTNGCEKKILAHPLILPALHSALIASTSSVGSSLSGSITVLPTPTSPLTSSSDPLLTPTAAATAAFGRAEARRPIVTCVSQLAHVNPDRIKEVGFESPLRHICEWAVGGMMGGSNSGSGGVGGGAKGGWDDDRDVVAQARAALHRLGVDLV